jgi:hypothetical protein
MVPQGLQSGFSRNQVTARRPWLRNTGYQTRQAVDLVVQVGDCGLLRKATTRPDARRQTEPTSYWT